MFIFVFYCFSMLKQLESFFMKLPNIINELKSPKEVENFIKDLCTPSEIKAINERWEVAQLLYKKDKSYREIAAELKTSTATVTRVARFLFSESNNGYQNAFKRIK
jgi:TrpR-related protein YerC/YecD